jgi:hypothetical protein
MAQRVVDLLEPVEVDEEDCQIGLVTRSRGACGAEPLVQDRSVCETRERVGASAEREALGSLCSLRDVDARPDQPNRFSRFVVLACHQQLFIMHRTVAAIAAIFDTIHAARFDRMLEVRDDALAIIRVHVALDDIVTVSRRRRVRRLRNAGIHPHFVRPGDDAGGEIR